MEAAGGGGREITLAMRARPAGDVLFRELGGEAVLLDTATGSYYGLNRVGARVWTLLAAGGTLGAVVAALAAEFDAPEERLRADVLALLDDLAASRLVVVEG